MRTRSRTGATGAAVAAFVFAAAAALAGGALKSGPQPGESVSAFQVRDITGPSKGKQLCYV